MLAGLWRQAHRRIKSESPSCPMSEVGWSLRYSHLESDSSVDSNGGDPAGLLEGADCWCQDGSERDSEPAGDGGFGKDSVEH